MKNKAIIDNKHIYKNWFWAIIIELLFVLALIASITIYIDPFFHYHNPLPTMEYPINNERYQNDGIVRQWDYDTIITGTSMVENFKTSECDSLFNCSSVKVPFSGGTYKEINDNLKRAFEANKNIRYVIRCLDYTHLVEDKDEINQEVMNLKFLTNKNPFDDVKYVLNKTILLDNTLEVIKYSKAGKLTTTFDEYANWNDQHTFGKEAVYKSYSLEEDQEVRNLTENEIEMVKKNIKQNVTDLAFEYPDTMFYIFFPPYSICNWDRLRQNGEIMWRIEAERYAIEELLKCPNIKLFSFCTNYEMICNLDNYMDTNHYGEWINSNILQWMQEDKYRITKENVKRYLENITGFYTEYDYGSLHE